MLRATARYARPPMTDAQVIERHQSLLRRCARAISQRTGGMVAADDLWSAGALGLLDAWSRFDPSRQVRFETFAEHRIRGAMLDELRRLDHLPRRLREATDKLSAARAELHVTLQREPETGELAEKLGCDVEEVMTLTGLSQPVLPITELLSLESSDENLDEQVAHTQRTQRLAGAIRQLPQRLQTIMGLYYQESLSYREIAGILEVSEPRVCQLHNQAMGQLRQILGDGTAPSEA